MGLKIRKHPIESQQLDLMQYENFKEINPSGRCMIHQVLSNHMG